MSKGLSGIVLEVISREVQCHYCDKDVDVAFLVARYRGTQSACQNLHYHKECLLEALSKAPPSVKLSKAECLICQKKSTNWKFVLRYYNYGGYHHKFLKDFISEHTVEYDELVLTIGADEKKKKEARRAMKSLKEEGDRILNKIW